ncbi:MAG: hypothetical protein ABPD24_00800 [Candidatus Shikimatogenerans sp. AspAUS03]|uniref:Beta sliding clamp n=1 Tax=Candidatus Shikimatogenerans sp. AspAUS03 TaxID=3158563 RepID=A0AAU7QS76_9FLAO
MKLLINPKIIYNYILPLLKITNNLLKILNNILLIIKRNYIIFFYTNLEIFIYIIIKNIFFIKKKKKILLPLKIFLNVLKNIYYNIYIYIKKFYIKLLTKYTSYKISTIKYKDYPKFKKFKKKHKLKIKIKYILYIIKYISFINYKKTEYMNGLFIKIKNHNIYFLNSNNRILVFLKKKNIINNNKTYYFFLTINAFLILKDYLNTNMNKYLNINFNSKYIEFNYNNIFIRLKYKKKKMPNYKLFYKKNKKYTLFINKNTLLASIKRISSINNCENIILKLFKNNKIIINNNNKINFFKENIIGNYKGKNIKYLINYKDLIIILNILDTLNIKFNFYKKLKFIIIKNIYLKKQLFKINILLIALNLKYSLYNENIL